MRKIYLVRHGQSSTNAGGPVQLNADIELTDLGHQQAQEVLEWFSQRLDNDITSIGVSRFKRTQQTAQPLVDKVNIQPHIIEGLQEFDYLSFSEVDGLPFKQRLRIADAYWLDHRPDDRHGEEAESFRMFYDRVAKVMTHFKTLPSGNHVVFTHGLWISMFIWQILGQPATKNKHMQKFRAFERSIRAKNCEVFCLTLAENARLSSYPPAITKVRSRHQNTDLSS